MDTTLPASPTDVLALRAGSDVLVVTGSFGAGHNAAAHEVRVRMEALGHRVSTVDVVDVMSAGHLLQRSYLTQMRSVPRVWGVLLSALRRWPALRAAIAWVLALACRRLDAEVTDRDLVICTHPFAGQALGRLRRRGRMSATVATYLTDASVHPLWVHPGVDTHLTWNPAAAAAVVALGGRAQVVRPLVPAVYDEVGPDRDAVRRRLGLAPAQPYALVVGGSEGIGQLRETALDLLGTGLTPVVVCGRAEALRERISGEPGVVALGWRDDLPDLIRAADLVVQNAGGFTCLEALAAGVPVVTYRSIPGHGEDNSGALAAAGLVPWAHDELEFWTLVDAAHHGRFPHPLPLRAPRLVDLVEEPCLVA